MAATHGQTVQEVLGSGDASQPNQTFTLKQMPLTYLSTPSGQGATSTLQIWVNDLLWQQEPNLLDATPKDRVYTTQQANSGAVTVKFGDGTNGARPPTGQTNVRALYRVGLGLSGNLPAGAISQAIDRPAGLKSVTNPGQCDRRRRSGYAGGRARQRAAARPDAGARRLPAGLPGLFHRLRRRRQGRRDLDMVRPHPRRRRHRGGSRWRSARSRTATPSATLPPPSASSGNPYVPVNVLPHQPQHFAVAGLVSVDTTDYDPTLVLAAVSTTLLTTFGFTARALGQGVAQSEVIAAIQSVPGVQGTQTEQLRPRWSHSRRHAAQLPARRRPA